VTRPFIVEGKTVLGMADRHDAAGKIRPT